MSSSIRRAWSQMWALPPTLPSATQEQAFLQDYCQRFAMHRRLAIVLGFFTIVAYLALDYVYAIGDPAFQARLQPVMWNRVITALQLVAFFGLALLPRFEQDETYANAVLVAGSFLNFLFHCHGFLLAPYPFDYMYFFMGMFICIIYGFAVLRLRARGVLVLMVLCLTAAAVTFALNWELKQSLLDSYAARIYQWAALNFLVTIAMIGFVVANLLERTARAAFTHAEALAASNETLRARSEEVARLNDALHAAVARAERESAARARVLASASHDLRQPLHALSIYSAILMADPAPETMGEVSVNINQIVYSLGELLHGLLDLSQLSSGNYAPARQRFMLDRLLNGILTEFEPSAGAKQLRLSGGFAPTVLLGDPMAVSRIARNLLDNAIKYTDFGSVRVQLHRDGGDAVLRVVDTGRGIAPVEQERIFEEFYQLDNPGRDRGRGVGLGLAIVRRLVELLGGRITIESRVAEGTSFEVRLPGVVSVAPMAVVEPEAPAPTALAAPASRSIYLVDDEVDILRSTGALLKMWRFRIRSATSVAEAELLFALHGPPDLFIVDLRLRGSEHGVALAHRLLAQYGGFAVLIVTGETSSAALREAGASGWRLLHKPISAAVLSDAIDSALASLPSAAA